MSDRVEFRLPLPPRRGNRRGHWYRHWKIESEWQRRAELEIYRQGVRYPPEPFPRARLSFHFRMLRLEDPDNLDARRKLIVDLLKVQWAAPDRKGRVRRLNMPPAADNVRAVRTREGFFLDDSIEYLEYTPTTAELVKARRHCGVIVTIERLDDHSTCDEEAI